MKRLTLESVYNKAKEEYAKRGYDENSWQWRDEGSVYAIEDYLSSCGELTDEDYAFAKKVCIEDEINFILNENN